MSLPDTNTAPAADTESAVRAWRRAQPALSCEALGVCRGECAVDVECPHPERAYPFAPGVIVGGQSRRYRMGLPLSKLLALCATASAILGLLAGMLTGWGQSMGWW